MDNLWQPRILENSTVRLRPLISDDLEAVCLAASDPLIWAQHPAHDRWKPEVAKRFFEGAMTSGGALAILDPQSGTLIGCTRFYDHSPHQRSVCIGYTFLSRSYWGSTYNQAVKLLMLIHAFAHADRVYFHIGAGNIRSRKAIERLGAKEHRHTALDLNGTPVPHIEYVIARDAYADGNFKSSA